MMDNRRKELRALQTIDGDESATRSRALKEHEFLSRQRRVRFAQREPAYMLVHKT